MKHQLLNSVLFLLLISSVSFAATGTKKDFLKKFPLKEGRYDTVLDAAHPVDFCEDEELDIALQEDGNDLTLTIGPKLVFAELQKPESITNSEKNCKVKTSNTLTENSLKQTIAETCGKKTNYFKTHFFKLTGDVIEYSFTANKKTETCKYKLLKEAIQK